MKPFLRNLHHFLCCFLILSLPIQLGKHFWPDWAMVSGIRIDYLSPTIYLTDILVLGLITAWVAERILFVSHYSHDKNRGLWDVNFGTTIVGQKFTFVLGCGGMLILVLVGILRSIDPLAGFYKLLKIIELVLLGVYACNLCHPEFSSGSIDKGIPKQVRNDMGSEFFNHLVMLFSITIIYSSLIAWGQFLKQASMGGIFWWLGERTFTSATPGIARVVWNGRLLLRPYATFPHPNVLAGYLAVVLPLIIANYMRIDTNCELRLRQKLPSYSSSGAASGMAESRSSRQARTVKRSIGSIENILNLLAVVLGIATLFITFSRAAWVVGGVGVVLSLCALGQAWRLKIKQEGVIPAKAGIYTRWIPHQVRNDKARDWHLRRKGYLFFIVFVFLSSCVFMFLGRERLLDLKFDTESIRIRQDLNEVAMEMIKKKPLIGVGLNNFIPSLAQFKKGLSFQELQPVHNIFLLIGAETGLVGLMVFLGLIYKAYQQLISKSEFLISKQAPSTKHQAFKKLSGIGSLGIGHYLNQLGIRSIRNLAKLNTKPLFISLTTILLLSLVDHYFFTLQQGQLLLAIVMGMVFGVK